MEKLNINKWALEDRPREKFIMQGAEKLSDAELLAILIGSGNTQDTAVGLMQKILSDCGNNLNTLGKMGLQELMEYNGIGEAKAVTILAACELGRRRIATQAMQRDRISSAAEHAARKCSRNAGLSALYDHLAALTAPSSATDVHS